MLDWILRLGRRHSMYCIGATIQPTIVVKEKTVKLSELQRILLNFSSSPPPPQKKTIIPAMEFCNDRSNFHCQMKEYSSKVSTSSCCTLSLSLTNGINVSSMHNYLSYFRLLFAAVLNTLLLFLSLTHYVLIHKTLRSIWLFCFQVDHDHYVACSVRYENTMVPFESMKSFYRHM